LKKQKFKSPVAIQDRATDEEIWAIIDCNTSTHAQDVMSRRIGRVCTEIQAEWNDVEREKRAAYIAHIPWKIPWNLRSVPDHGENE